MAVHRRQRGKQIKKYLALDDHVRIGEAERTPGLWGSRVQRQTQAGEGAGIVFGVLFGVVRAACVIHVFQRDGAAVESGDFAHERQAEAAALGRAVRSGQRKEALKQPCMGVIRDAAAVVPDADFKPVFGSRVNVFRIGRRMIRCMTRHARQRAFDYTPRW